MMMILEQVLINKSNKKEKTLNYKTKKTLSDHSH
jgi:hypothetical protein